MVTTGTTSAAVPVMKASSATQASDQPWTVSEVLPTWLSVSSLTVGDLLFSLTGFVVLYTALLVVELYLMVKFARLGPEGRTPDSDAALPDAVVAAQPAVERA